MAIKSVGNRLNLTQKAYIPQRTVNCDEKDQFITHSIIPYRYQNVQIKLEHTLPIPHFLRSEKFR